MGAEQGREAGWEGAQRRPSLSHPKCPPTAAMSPLTLRAGGGRTGTAARDPGAAPLPIMWLATWIWISRSFSKVIWHLMHW